MSTKRMKTWSHLLTLALFGLALSVEAADEAVDGAFDALKTFKSGEDRKVLKPIDDAVVGVREDAAARKALAARLAAVLKTDASRAAKDFVCRKLSIIGAADSVSALAPLLTDDELSHMARYALERIPSPEAVKALRAALPKVKGELKAGVINSLGVRRDASSTKALAALLRESDHDVAAAAAAALGDIGTVEAAKALGALQKKAPKAIRAAVTDAYLECAERLLAAGKKAEAMSIYKALDSPEQPEHVRSAAKRGLEKASGKK